MNEARENHIANKLNNQTRKKTEGKKLLKNWKWFFHYVHYSGTNCSAWCLWKNIEYAHWWKTTHPGLVKLTAKARGWEGNATDSHPQVDKIKMDGFDGGSLCLFFVLFVSLIENSLDAIYWHCVDLILRYSWAPLFRAFCPFAQFCIMILCRTNELEKRKNSTLMLCALMLCACEARQRCSFPAYFLYLLQIYMPIDANSSYPKLNDLRFVRQKRNKTQHLDSRCHCARCYNVRQNLIDGKRNMHDMAMLNTVECCIFLAKCIMETSMADAKRRKLCVLLKVYIVYADDYKHLKRMSNHFMVFIFFCGFWLNSNKRGIPMGWNLDWNRQNQWLIHTIKAFGFQRFWVHHSWNLSYVKKKPVYKPQTTPSER